MNQLQAIRVFLCICDAGSFARAAAQLNLSRSVITRHVSQLEAHLQVRLLNRTTRTVSLTEAGHAYLAGCRSTVAQLETLDADVGRVAHDASGQLRLVVSSSVASLWLAPFLVRFRREQPRVQVDVSVLDAPVDLVEQGFDVGLMQTSMLRSLSAIRRPVARLAPVLVATPAYLSRGAALREPEQLVRHALLSPALEPGAEGLSLYRHGELRIVRLTPAMQSTHAETLRRGALAGVGVALVPHALASEAIRAQALTQVLPEWTVDGGDETVSLVYPARRHLSAKMRVFVEAALAWFREQEEREGGGLRDFREGRELREAVTLSQSALPTRALRAVDAGC